MSESRTNTACSLHEVEIHRLWQAVVSGQSAPWMASRWVGGGVGSLRRVPSPAFKPQGLSSLKKAIAEGIAFWMARQDGGCGWSPWNDRVAENIAPLRIGPEALGVLSGLVHGKLPDLSRTPQGGRVAWETTGNQLLMWILGDWALTHASFLVDHLVRHVSPDTQLLLATCHPRLLGLLPPEGPTAVGETPVPSANSGPENVLFNGSSGGNGTSKELGWDLLPWVEGALATRLERAWKHHHNALKEATSFSRIQERAQWGRQTWPVWDALLNGKRSSFWLGRLMRWVGEVLEPMEGSGEAFADEMDWKGTPLAQRQGLRRDSFLALRIGVCLTQKYENSLRVGYLDEAYDEAQGTLRLFRDAGEAPWRERIPLFVRELSPIEASATPPISHPNRLEQQ